MGPKVKYLLGGLGSSAFCGPLLWFVGTHRIHHKHADTEDDIHSPVTGIFHAYHGWLLKKHYRNRKGWKDMAKAHFRDKTDANIHRHYLTFVVAGLVIPTLLWWGLFNDPLAGFLWGGVARVWFVIHLHCFINVWGHSVGTQPSGQRDNSRNTWWLTIPTFGISLHNNHHTHPTYASWRFRWYEIDPSAMWVWLFEKLGLIWDVKRGKTS